MCTHTHTYAQTQSTVSIKGKHVPRPHIMAAVRMRASGIGLLKQEVCSLRVAGGDQVGRTFAEGLQQEASTPPISGADTCHVQS